MALPALNNTNTLSNIPMDANYISRAVLTAASRTGHLQIYNNGNISFNNNISGGTATKESSGSVFGGISILTEIRNHLESINRNISKSIETNQRQSEISQNLAEAQNQKKDFEVQRKDNQDSKFDAFISKMQESFSSKSVGGGSSGGMGLLGGGLLLGGAIKNLFGLGSSLKQLFRKTIRGIFGKRFQTTLMSVLGKTLVKSLGGILTAYLAASEIGKIKIGDKTIAERIKGYVDTGVDELSNFFGKSSDLESLDKEPETGEMSTGESYSSETYQQSSGQTTQSNRTTGKNATPVKPLPAVRRNSSGEISGLKFSHKDQSKINERIAGIALELQNKLGKKFLVVSGYRSPEYNAKIGGAKNSAHTRGNAVDLHWESGKLSKEDFLKIIPIASSLGALGIGIYPSSGFIHLDVDSNGRRAWGQNGRRNSVPDWAEKLIKMHERNEFVGQEYIENQENSDKDLREQEPTSPDDIKSSSPTEENKQTSPLMSNPEKVSSDNAEETSSLTKGTTYNSERVFSENSGNAEEEEEAEETSEKILTDPSLKAPTAIKENKNDYPEDIKKLFDDVERQYNLPRGILKGIAETETGPIGPENTLENKSKKVSNKGAQGLMQIVPGTAKELGLRDPFDAKQSIAAAGKYLGENIPRQLGTDDEKITKDPSILAAAYNAGAKNVKKAGYKVPEFSETKKYVQKVAAAMGVGVGTTQLAQTETEGGSAKPTTFGEKAKRVGEALSETAENVIESGKDVFSKFTEEFMPDRNTVNTALSYGVNTLYDVMRVDPRKRVKIKDGKVVPYVDKQPTKPPTLEEKKLLAEEDPIAKVAHEFFHGKGDRINGEQLYTSSTEIRSGEQKLAVAKQEAPSQPTIINNTSPQRTEKNPDGVGGAVPPVRDKNESTLLEMQYRNLSAV